jgi:hypothetical protein
MDILWHCYRCGFTGALPLGQLHICPLPCAPA